MTSTALSIPAWAQVALVNGNRTALTDAATGGVGGKAEFPHISIKQGRWRLIDIEGEERVLDSFSIAFAVVSINSNVSKAWYARKYQPGDEPSAPDCYSNNGLVPLPDADMIQSQQCATCDKNVWGSDVNPNNGNRLKACKDAKHIALMFLDDANLQAEAPEVYSQRLAAMSMINFSNFAKEVAAQGGALDFIVVKAEFDTDADYPLVKYSVLRNMTQDEWTVVNRVRNEERAQRACNGDQKVIPILAERVNHVPLREGIAGSADKATGEVSAAMVDQQREKEAAEAARKERIAKANAEAKRIEAQNAEVDQRRMKARADELARGAEETKVVDPAVLAKAKKLAEAKAAFEAAQRELELEANAGVGADNPAAGRDPDATNVRKITDVQEKPRQRHPVNTVSPDPATPDMDDLLSQAMAD